MANFKNGNIPISICFGMSFFPDLWKGKLVQVNENVVFDLAIDYVDARMCKYDDTRLLFVQVLCIAHQ
jgi:hypothetical protein